MNAGLPARWFLCALAAIGADSSSSSVAQDEKKPAQAAARQYAAAAALQNREEYELAAEEWARFLASFPEDLRADRAQHYLGICQLKNKQYALALDSFSKVIAGYPKSELLPSTHLHLGIAQYNLALAGEQELYAEAGETFAALLDNYPQAKEVPQALFYWGESLWARGQKDEAALMYGELVKDHPQDPLLPEALYALGVTQEELGQQAAAGKTYAVYLRQFADGPLATEVGMRYGETLMAQGKVDQAQKWFAAAAAKEGFALADLATMRQAACFYERKMYDEAAALYAALPARFPDSTYKAAAQLAAGKCAYLAGKPAEARNHLAKVLEAGGDTAVEAAHWLARSYLKDNQPAEALKVAEAALAEAGQSPYAVQVKMDQADALYELADRRRESVALYAALAAQHPDDALAPQALYMAAYASLGLADYEPALANAGKFLERFAAHDLAADVIYVAAECNLQLSRFAEAGQFYQSLLEKYPQHDQADSWKVRRGLVLYLERKFPEAVAALEPIATSLGSKQLAAEAQYLLGSSHNELAQFDAALKALAASLQADPAWRQADETLVALAHAHRQLNDIAAAKARLADLIARFPASRVLDRAHYRLGEYAYAQGDYAAAAAEYRLVVEQHPTSVLVPHALYNLGWTQLSQADHAAALTTLDGLVANYAQSDLVPRARYARAMARQQLQQFAPAIEDLQAFLQTKPPPAEKSDAQYVLALCQAGLQRPAEAETTLGGLLEENPQYSGADKVLYELAWAEKSQDKPAEAAETFARLAQEHADSPLAAESLYHVGEHRYQKEEYQEAAAAYHQAMNKAGKSDLGERAAHKLGWAYFRLEAFDRAHGAFSYQRATFPQGALYADAAFMEAESLFKQSKYQEALAAYDQVKDPAGKDFAVLALLHAGQAAGQLNEWDRSLELLERAASKHAESDWLPEILYEQGWAQQNLGRHDGALALYESVTAQTDREVAARARFMVGEIHFEQKNHSEAVRNFFKVAYGYSYPQWQANAHYEAARCFEVLGKKDQAARSYQEVVEKFPQSDKAALAKERLDALKL